MSAIDWRDELRWFFFVMFRAGLLVAATGAVVYAICCVAMLGGCS